MCVRLMQIVYQIKLLLTAVVGRIVLNNQLDNNDNIFFNFSNRLYFYNNENVQYIFKTFCFRSIGVSKQISMNNVSNI